MSPFSRFSWLGFSALILIADQVSKWFVTEQYLTPKIRGLTGEGFIAWFINTPERLQAFRVEVTPFFNIVMAWNTGVSFSLFSDAGGIMPYILIAVALAITGLFIFWLKNADTKWHSLAYALVIGGALGNVIDRARFGAVIDFLDFHIAGHHWPAFNVADMAVVCGVILLIIVSLAFDLKHKEGYSETQSTDQDEANET